MPRFRPSWRAPFIPYPKDAKLAGVGALMRERRTSFGDFSAGSGRRQCKAIAKSTGARCRRDCVQGVGYCRSHRGVLAACVKLRARGILFKRAPSGGEAREALAAIGFAGPPEGLDIGETARGIVARGRLFEAFRNREMSPAEYRKARLVCQTKP